MGSTITEKAVLSIMLIATLSFVIFGAATTPVQEVLEVYDAKVVLAYRTGGAMHARYNCDLRLDSGLIVNASCSESNKKGDKVFVAKVKSKGPKYIIQEPIKK